MELYFREANMVKKLILIDAGGFPLVSKSVPIAFRLAETPVITKHSYFYYSKIYSKIKC